MVLKEREMEIYCGIERKKERGKEAFEKESKREKESLNQIIINKREKRLRATKEE